MADYRSIRTVESGEFIDNSGEGRVQLAVQNRDRGLERRTSALSLGDDPDTDGGLA